MTLPNRIFITGAPGSKWTSVTHLLETVPGANTSDRGSHRHFDHPVFQGHHGAYFGLPHRKYEATCSLDGKNIDSFFADSSPGKFVKGHDWAYYLDDLKETFPGDWLVMISRPDLDCYTWWNQHGGFTVEYPSYETYFPDHVMMAEILKLNHMYHTFAQQHDQKWEYFGPRWVKDNFGHDLTEQDMKALNHDKTYADLFTFFTKCMVCLVKL
jgi:hypothetical protein